MLYKVVVRKSDEEYSVSCPVLPGFWSQVDSEDDATENVHCAIKEYLDVLGTLR
jgi:predicted RNase H-like HicB family nuclease